jgi:hypothetical protein
MLSHPDYPTLPRPLSTLYLVRLATYLPTYLPLLSRHVYDYSKFYAFTGFGYPAATRVLTSLCPCAYVISVYSPAIYPGRSCVCSLNSAMENTSCFSLSIFGDRRNSDRDADKIGSFIFSDSNDFNDLLTCCCLAFDAEKRF